MCFVASRGRLQHRKASIHLLITEEHQMAESILTISDPVGREAAKWFQRDSGVQSLDEEPPKSNRWTKKEVYLSNKSLNRRSTWNFSNWISKLLFYKRRKWRQMLAKSICSGRQYLAEQVPHEKAVMQILTQRIMPETSVSPWRRCSPAAYDLGCTNAFVQPARRYHWKLKMISVQ